MMNKLQNSIEFPKKQKETYKIRRKITLAKPKALPKEIRQFKTEQTPDQTSQDKFNKGLNQVREEVKTPQKHLSLKLKNHLLLNQNLSFRRKMLPFLSLHLRNGLDSKIDMKKARLSFE